ncbi:glycosyltransferase [Cupriavidus basilensis]
MLVGGKGWLTGELEREIAPGVACRRGTAAWLRGRSGSSSFLVAGALATVYPSIYEGFGLPRSNPWRAACPAICSNRSAIPEVVADGGILLEPGDIDQFSAAMARIAGDYAWRAQIAEQGLKRATQFSWRRSAGNAGCLP